MPELPEVEFARRCLLRWLLNHPLAAVEAEPSRVLRDASSRDLRDLRALTGARLERVDRLGKQLLLRFDDGRGLLSHLGMTGRWELQRPGEPPVKHSRFRLVRDDGAVVHYRDPRMFGRIRPGDAEALERDPSLTSLGPDALDDPPTASRLLDAFAGRRRTIKEALMDQAILAGLGNIQATEALFRARLSPRLPAGELTRSEAERLVRAIRWTLERTLKDLDGGDSITYVEESRSPENNPFLVYGRAGEPCPRCGTTLESIRLGGRTTVFCPSCQPG